MYITLILHHKSSIFVFFGSGILASGYTDFVKSIVPLADAAFTIQFTSGHRLSHFLLNFGFLHRDNM